MNSPGGKAAAQTQQGQQVPAYQFSNVQQARHFTVINVQSQNDAMGCLCEFFERMIEADSTGTTRVMAGLGITYFYSDGRKAGFGAR